ncbi:uncharacterized protein LOC132284670 [Cornus florida]|uniref:uncharacterized protein LOC132284670 n=1 Tax=Cornus florida TaxID=4283 RepID=UPI00289FB724|nr:uncharacterized protein LOC132284670 [Cornus florida]
MASVTIMSTPLNFATQRRIRVNQPSSEAFFSPLPVKKNNKGVFGQSKPRKCRLIQVDASLKEKAVTGLTAAALTASMVIPQVAEAADSGLSPSLKNFLLSIAAGGVVLVVILGVVVGVSNFDPVKRT